MYVKSSAHKCSLKSKCNLRENLFQTPKSTVISKGCKYPDQSYHEELSVVLIFYFIFLYVLNPNAMRGNIDIFCYTSRATIANYFYSDS